MNSDTQPLPELNTDNNHARMTLLFTDGKRALEPTLAPSTIVATKSSTMENVPVPPSSTDQKEVASGAQQSFFSRHLTKIGIVAGAVVCVVLLLAIVIVVTLVLLRRLRSRRVRSNSDKAFLTTEYTLNN